MEGEFDQWKDAIAAGTRSKSEEAVTPQVHPPLLHCTEHAHARRSTQSDITKTTSDPLLSRTRLASLFVAWKVWVGVVRDLTLLLLCLIGGTIRAVPFASATLRLGGDRLVRLTQRTLDEFENEGGRFANLRALGAQDYEAMHAADDDDGDEGEVQVAVI